jgi:long-subunit acyl-CoA synthetase (AMP-forming)
VGDVAVDRGGDVGARLGSASSLCEVFQETAATRPDAVALRTVGGPELSWQDWSARIDEIAGGLAGLGVGHGDAVALMLLNRPEFALIDAAAMHLGAIPFSIYNTFPAETIGHLLANAECRVAVCEAAFAERLLAAAPGTALEHVVCLEDGVAGTIPLAELPARRPAGFELEESWRAVAPEDVLTLIYTSGTTGPPKGVEITHANMLAELRGMADALPVTPGGRTVSYLPAAHIADRWASLYTGMAHGLTTTYLADPAQLGAALLDVRPTVWGGVPRVWEKLQAGLQAAIAAQPQQVRTAVEEALATGLEVVRREQSGEAPDEALAAAHRAAEEGVLRGLRERLGLDRLEWAVIGAAPAPRELLEYFCALGVPLLELWGMSELSCACTTNRPGRNRIGTVGQAITGGEVRIAGDGELLVRGELVMRGYRSEPQRTAEALDGDGWLHTGDIGSIDEDGFVSIVDRKKELIINAAGKNMSPANIESRLKASHPVIGQAICIGDRRPYNVALLVLEPEAAAVWARDHGLADVDTEQLAAREDLLAEVARAVDAANEHLARVEQIKRFRVLGSEWMPGGEELTPTMKLRRKPILAKYEAEIEALYAR